MAFYLYQFNYTAEAIKGMVSNPSDRRAAADKVAAATGGKVHQFFFSFGAHDAALIVEAPDDKAMAAIALIVASGGTSSNSLTTKLMTMDEGMDAMKLAAKTAGSYKGPTA